MSENSVKFGFIKQTVMSYSCKYQNVSLFKKNNDKLCGAEFKCKVICVKNIVIPENSQVKLEVKKNVHGKYDDVYLIFKSDKSELNFTCTIDSKYKRTFMVNNEILFECNIDPIDFNILYVNMECILKEWVFK